MGIQSVKEGAKRERKVEQSIKERTDLRKGSKKKRGEFSSKK